MNRVFSVLAIAALVLTVAGAGVVLYGINTMTPQVESVNVLCTPAVQAQETFDALLEEMALGTFSGRQFAAAEGLGAQDCTFITYSVRLRNKGFFPAEWISLQVSPQQSEDGAQSDILQMGDHGAYVLGAGSRGDLHATILHAGDASHTARQLTVTCYVFGQRVQFEVQAQ